MAPGGLGSVGVSWSFLPWWWGRWPRRCRRRRRNEGRTAVWQPPRKRWRLSSHRRRSDRRRRRRWGASARRARRESRRRSRSWWRGAPPPATRGSTPTGRVRSRCTTCPATSRVGARRSGCRSIRRWLLIRIGRIGSCRQPIVGRCRSGQRGRHRLRPAQRASQPVVLISVQNAIRLGPPPTRRLSRRISARPPPG